MDVSNAHIAPPPASRLAEPTRGLAASETLRQKTLVKLREAIVTGELKPDHRLVERDVCVQTGVSRSSVREALRYLESEGLVESRGTKGMFVVKLSIDEALEIYELRTAVEIAAARHFTERASEEELQELASTYNAVRVAATVNADEYWRQTDRLFDIMMRGARNNVAYSLMTTLRTRIRYLRATTTRQATPRYREESVQRMGALTIALCKRDSAAATNILSDFIARSARFAAECLRQRDQELDEAG
jgi:DNA-binding GntR family transcriptional regulator